MDLEKKRNNLGLYVYNVFADSSKKDKEVAYGLDPIFRKQIKYVFEQVVKYLKKPIDFKDKRIKIC